MTEPRVLTTRPMQRTFPGRADQIARAREFTQAGARAVPGER